MEKLDEDKEASSAALRNASEAIPEPISSAIEYAGTNEQNPYFLWPSYVVSVTDGWISKGGKGSVVLIGDVVLVFPPHGGRHLVGRDERNLTRNFRGGKQEKRLQIMLGL